MKRRLLTCFAAVPLAFAVLTAGPAGAPSGTHAAPRMYVASVREPVPVEMAASVSEPARHAADAFDTLAGAMVVASAAAFAATATMRRRRGVRR